MPPSAYFQDLPTVLCRQLSQARQNIRIAVCWFSHREIFEVLLKKLRAGISVELLLEYDSQNISQQGLDFQKFIKLGGTLYAYRDTALMHHKFALIDDQLLLSGSFNWTYNSNAENLIVSAEPALIEAFRQEYNRLKAVCVQVRKIRPAEAKVFANYPLFQNTHFQVNDLRRRISGGAGVWWVRLGQELEDWQEAVRTHRLPFDPGSLLAGYWRAYRLWDHELLEEIWPELSATAKPAAARAVRTLAKRVRIGDLVLALVGKQEVVALGIVQSDPRPAEEGEFSSYREVQWLRVFTEEPFLLEKPVPPGFVGRFRGSALRVVQGMFDSFKKN